MRKIYFGIAALVLCLLGIFLVSNYAMAASNSAGGIVVQTIPGPTLAQTVVERAQGSWPWYLVRGSGIIAAITMVILMLSGIGMITGHTFKFLEPITAWASHRALGIILGVSVLIHMFGLLFDKFIPFSLATLFVPWLSNYQPVTIFGVQLGSLYVALGVLAFYLIAMIVITSLVWIEKRAFIWKLIHLLSYLVILMVFIHALYLGTDLKQGVLRYLWIAAGLAIAFSVYVRLKRAKSV